MASILYGVTAKARVIRRARGRSLRTCSVAGTNVHVASFDRGLRNLRDEFEVTEISGLRLAYVQNRVRYGRTVLRNLVGIPQVARSVRALERKAENWDLDLVITDFEPICCHVGRKFRLPIIAVDNQHVLTDADISYPKEYRREATAAKMVTRVMTPRANTYLVISFFPARVRKKYTFLFPPILREAVLNARPSESDFVLVYVTSAAGELADVLKRVRQRFVCYGFNREGEDGNLVFRKPSLDTFLRDLCSCRAVIANAGFSLISEALHLGKPYLAWPVKRQFEQVFNAYYIAQTGYGVYWEDLNKEQVDSFLFNLDCYKENLAKYPRQDNSALLGKLDELITAYTK